MVIDVAKFAAPIRTHHLLTVVSLPDAGKVIQNKNLHRVKPDDPEIAKEYAVFSSDEAWARAAVTSKLISRMEAVNRGVRARLRVQVAGGKAVLVALRGLADPDELRSFHDGCAGVLSELNSAIPAVS